MNLKLLPAKQASFTLVRWMPQGTHRNDDPQQTVTPLEYRDALKRLEMSIDDAAKLQGITEAISRKRALGTAKIPPEAAVLLRLMLALRLSARQVTDHIANST